MASSNDDWTGISPMNGEAPTNGQIVTKGGLEADGHSTGPISSLSMSGLLKGLRRRWLLASSLGVVCAAIAATSAWYFLPPGKYTARALLRVDSVPYMVLQDGQARSNFQFYQKTQIALVKSRLVLDAAVNAKSVGELSLIRELDQRGNGEEAIEWLERELQVDFSVAPEILRIALSGDRPDELKIIVDAVKQA